MKDWTYRNVHRWVAYHFGRPHKCEDCGDTQLNHRQYHWANISGEYKREFNDWKRLCAKCHKLFDGYSLWNKRYCKRGHFLSIDNLYLHHKSVECKKCNKLNLRKFRSQT